MFRQNGTNGMNRIVAIKPFFLQAIQSLLDRGFIAQCGLIFNDQMNGGMQAELRHILLVGGLNVRQTLRLIQRVPFFRIGGFCWIVFHVISFTKKAVIRKPFHIPDT